MVNRFHDAADRPRVKVKFGFIMCCNETSVRLFFMEYQINVSIHEENLIWEELKVG